MNTNVIHTCALNRRPLGRGALRAAVAALGCLAALGGTGRPAISVVPPYAEEWAVPGLPQDVEVDPSGRVWVSCADDSIRVFTRPAVGCSSPLAAPAAATESSRIPMAWRSIQAARSTSAITRRPPPEVHQRRRVPSRLADSEQPGATTSPRTRRAMSMWRATPTSPSTSYDRPALLSQLAAMAGPTTAGIVVVGGTVNVVQWGAPAVEQFTTAGLPRLVYDGAIGGTDIEVDALDQLWVADYASNVIRVFTAGGDPIDVLGEPGTGPGQFLGAIGVGVGTDGSIYVADEANSRIHRFGEPVAATPQGYEARPASLAFRSIGPNPCRDSVELMYTATRAENIRLTLTDVSGRTVATLTAGPVTAGEHRLVWGTRTDDGRRLAAGNYLVRLTGESGTSVARLVVIG